MTPDEQLRWKPRGCRTLLENQYITLLENDYELPDGAALNGFYVVHDPESASIVAVTRGLQLVLVRQYRPAIDEILYEFPGGLLEPGDGDALARAQIELSEETGYATQEWQFIGVTRPAPHRLSTRQNCFLASNVEKVEDQRLEESEFLGIELVPVADLHEMIRGGTFNCGACISSFFHAMQTDPRLREGL